MERQFEKIDQIGRGVFAKVYKARIIERFRMPGDPEFVALKYIDAKHQNDILSESIFLKKSNCPFIIKCYHTFLSEDGENIIIALELCKNTLKNEMGSLRGNMFRIIQLFLQCVKGLRYIHNRRRIHRDIKPDNILIDFEGNAKIADFNVMKNLESSLAKTQKGTPLYMAPEVAYGEKYSEKVDIWSLCATFYYLFKSHGPYYNNTVKSSVELMIRKKDVKNYEKLSEFYCSNPTLRDIINYNLSSPDEKRMSAEEIIELLEDQAMEMQLSNLTSEDCKETIFGKTNGTNFMDETLISQEINPSQLNKDIKNSLTEKTEYKTNAVSMVEDTKNRDYALIGGQNQIEKKYDDFEKNRSLNMENYNSKLNFVKAKKIDDTVNQSDFKHIGIKPSILHKNESEIRRDIAREYLRRNDSPELAVVNISNEEKKLGNVSENNSIEEEFEEQDYNFSSDEEDIKVEVEYDDEEQKKKDQYIFDSMMIERPDDLKEPQIKKIHSENRFDNGHFEEDQDTFEAKLMDTFLSRTEGDELEYSKSMMMPTPKTFKKNPEEKPKKYKTENPELFRKHNSYMKNNLIRTRGNDSHDEIDQKKVLKKKATEEKFEEDFGDYGDFDDEDYLDDYNDDIEFDENRDLDKTERTTFQGEKQSESFYQTQFGIDSVVKTKDYVKGNFGNESASGNLFHDFEYIN